MQGFIYTVQNNSDQETHFSWGLDYFLVSSKEHIYLDNDLVLICHSLFIVKGKFYYSYVFPYAFCTGYFRGSSFIFWPLIYGSQIWT